MIFIYSVGVYIITMSWDIIMKIGIVLWYYNMVTMKTICALTLAGLFIVVQPASAACSYRGNSVSTSHAFGDIVISPTAAVNSVIHTESFGAPASTSGVVLNCNSGNHTIRTYFTEAYTNVSNNIVSTDIPGIGLRVKTFSPGVSTGPMNTVLPFTGQAFLNGSIFGGANFSVAATTMTFEFIKTSNTTGSGRLKSGVKYTASSLDNLETSHVRVTQGARIIPASCTVSNPSQTVILGEVSASLFTGVHTKPARRDFSVGIQCNGGSRVNVKLKGTLNTEIINDDILALTDAGSSGVASGVGVQIWSNGTALKLDQTTFADNIPASGAITLQFSAVYYQTRAEVKPGSANALATLEVTHQ